MSSSYFASGNISPSRFVKLDTTYVDGGYVLQAGAGDKLIGVAQDATHAFPYLGLDDGYAAASLTNQLGVWTPNDECKLEAGAACTVGDLLKSDTNGKGIPTTADGDYYGARALQAATAAGQLIRARVELGYRGA